VADGVFFAELNEMLTRELAEDGYSGVEVRVTPCAPMRDGGHGVGPRRAATRGGGAGLRRAWRR